jgi:Tfp pilus assembly protein PilF
MGMAYLEGNKKKDAAQHFKEALKINPNFTEAKKMLQKIHV